MMLYLLKVIYLMAPAGFANMAPIFTRKILKSLAVPIDSNLKLKGRPLLGKNKTVRGLVMGIIFSIVMVYLQVYLYKYPFFSDMGFFDYTQTNILLLGFLMGFGALAGDAIKSFFKRRVGIKPGERFIPWDQIDWVVGLVVFTIPVLEIYTLKLLVYLLVTGFVLHIVLRHLGYYLRINSSKW